MIKATLVGLGKMGISHASIIGAHPNVDLVAVCDTSNLVISGIKRFTKYKTYSDYLKMLEDEKPEAVFIATPTKLHYSMVKSALEKGMHVFCEKPFMLNPEQGLEMVKLARLKGKVNQVGYHNHFIGTFREMKRLINAGILGELLHFSGEAYGPVVTKAKGGTWRSSSEEGGGCLYDYASHVINLIQVILANPTNVKGTLLKSFYSKGVEDAVYSMLELENGLSGTLLVNWSDETFRKMSTSLSVQGKNGKIICDATEIKIYLKEPVTTEKLDKGWTIKYITDFALPVNFYLRGEEYSAQIDHFVRCIIEQQQSDVNTFEQAWKTDEAIKMIKNDTN